MVKSGESKSFVEKLENDAPVEILRRTPTLRVEAPFVDLPPEFVAEKGVKRSRDWSVLTFASERDRRAAAELLIERVGQLEAQYLLPLEGTARPPSTPRASLYGPRKYLSHYINQEVETQLHYGNVAVACVLLLWNGHLTRAKALLKSRGKKMELVELAAVAEGSGDDSALRSRLAEWKEQGRHVQAATAHLWRRDASRCVSGAVDYLVEHRYYRDAVLLARLRLLPSHASWRAAVERLAQMHVERASAPYEAALALDLLADHLTGAETLANGPDEEMGGRLARVAMAEGVATGQRTRLVQLAADNCGYNLRHRRWRRALRFCSLLSVDAYWPCLLTMHAALVCRMQAVISDNAHTAAEKRFAAGNAADFPQSVVAVCHDERFFKAMLVYWFDNCGLERTPLKMGVYATQLQERRQGLLNMEKLSVVEMFVQVAFDCTLGLLLAAAGRTDDAIAVFRGLRQTVYNDSVGSALLAMLQNVGAATDEWDEKLAAVGAAFVDAAEEEGEESDEFESAVEEDGEAESDGAESTTAVDAVSSDSKEATIERQFAVDAAAADELDDSATAPLTDDSDGEAAATSSAPTPTALKSAVVGRKHEASKQKPIKKKKMPKYKTGWA